ncbi:hypothetical protein SAMN05444161_5824 [Rhizobiales bacterium GAS191]|nr:hypothetical protein SAMN05519103_05017 [Rhizobiales bacterium GAS113]SEE45732.1 hypothetical protein SAMN05444161_5824 [Rhizobiales bacterium GAS191]
MLYGEACSHGCWVPIVHTLVRLAPTLTKLSECEGAVVVTGSHGGRYCGRLAVAARLLAAIFHDAGVGLDAAGIAALALLEERGIAAAAASHLSCRVGDTDDMMRRGIISHANAMAAACGVEAGLACATAAERLTAAPHRLAEPPAATESRQVLMRPGARRAIVLIDSASLVDPNEDQGAIIVTGSHGGLVGGDHKMALRVDGFAAAFNDAGIGIDRAGLGRLAPLDARGIAAITVAAATARIGEARSTFTGVISAANERARALGAQEGMSAGQMLETWAKA